MIKLLFAVTTVVFLFSCGGGNNKKLSEENRLALLARGDSIASHAQQLLMQNVAAAIQKGGTDYAVEFCNIRAVPLTDSIAGQYNSFIQRLSNKNRNPANAIQSDEDKAAWEKIETEKKHFVQQAADGSVSYYKPITIAMPTCLKCHGSSNDITESTLQIIKQKYPADLALNYAMNDLRGLWKIKLQ